MLSSTLRPDARRLFPLLDPTVGRAVGAYFQFQKNQGQAESLKLLGSLDDQDPTTDDSVSLTLNRNSAGTVEIRGEFAGLPVEIDVVRAERQKLRDKSNLIWGHAGETTDQTAAVMEGRVGPYPCSGSVTTYRQEIDKEMTAVLQNAGKAIYVLPFALSVTPTFGGAPAKVNGLPGDTPTASTPLETTDRTSVDAQLGDLGVKTEQNWVTTTWTVSTNLRAGGSRVTMMQAESASETEVATSGSEAVKENRQYEVISGKAALSSNRSYDLDFQAGVVSGNLRAGDASLSFQLKPVS